MSYDSKHLPSLIFGKCAVCGKRFQPQVKNGKVVGRKYYCSDECFHTPVFHGTCRYCGMDVAIDAEMLRNRRGKFPDLCDSEECQVLLKRDQYVNNRDFERVKRLSLRDKQCKRCGATFSGLPLSLYCEKCVWDLNHRQCLHCGETFEIRSNNDRKVCDQCVVGEVGRYVAYCDDEQFEHCVQPDKNGCSRWFRYGSPKAKRCIKLLKCPHGLEPLHCQICSPRKRVQDHNRVLEHSPEVKDVFGHRLALLPLSDEGRYHKVCRQCGRQYLASSPNGIWCGACWWVVKCQACGCDFVTDDPLSVVCGQECSGILFHQRGNVANPNIGTAYRNFHFKVEDQVEIPEGVEITEENLEQFAVPGVWWKQTVDDQVLDVCLTMNVAKEVEWHHWALEHIVNEKYLKMSTMGPLKLFWYGTFKTWEDGLRMEFDLAMKTHAKLWNPAPGPQMTWAREIKEDKDEEK